MCESKRSTTMVLVKKNASCQMIYLLWSNDEKNTTKKYFQK